MYLHNGGEVTVATMFMKVIFVYGDIYNYTNKPIDKLGSKLYKTVSGWRERERFVLSELGRMVMGIYTEITQIEKSLNTINDFYM